jgi:hypothetical protein
VLRDIAVVTHADEGQAIPKIVHKFDSLRDVGWYGSAYLLTTTSLQPSFGKIYTYFNVKYTFIAALTIFESLSTPHHVNCRLISRQLAPSYAQWRQTQRC